MRPLRNTERVLRNAAVDRLLEKEKALGSALAFADIAAEVSGVYPRIMQQGEMDAGVWSCGMVAGSSTTFRRSRADRSHHGRSGDDHPPAVMAAL
jgi:hypothetical protein